jgi:hypothetical protein
MKKKQFEAICKQLLPHLPGYTSKGWYLFEEPVGHVLRGFCCGDSRWDKEIFNVTVFFLPLYALTETAHQTFGDQLKDDHRCDKWWNVNEPDLIADLLNRIRRQGLPFLQGTETAEGLVHAARKHFGNWYGNLRNAHQIEGVGYSLMMIGDVGAGRRELDRLIAMLDPPAYEWDRAMQERATRLNQASPEEAQRLLTGWESETRANLRPELGEL